MKTKLFLPPVAIAFAMVMTASLSAQSTTVDIGANLPATLGGTTTLSDGTTITINQFTGGTGGGLGDIYPNTSASDFDFDSSTPGVGSWSFIEASVDFGTDFGVNNDGIVSAIDLSLGVSSQNGSSNWYEFGFIDLNGNDTSIAEIQSYLNTPANYDNTEPFVSIVDALGVDFGNADQNNFAGGEPVSGTGSTNDTWDNTDFGLADTTAITGFNYYYGAVTSDDRSSSPGGSIGSLTDARTTVGVPEPSSVIALLGLAATVCLRRRRG